MAEEIRPKVLNNRLDEYKDLYLHGAPNRQRRLATDGAAFLVR